MCLKGHFTLWVEAFIVSHHPRKFGGHTYSGKWGIMFLRRTLRSETIFGNWKLFENDEKCFYFTSEALFVLNIFKFLS